MGNKVKKAIEFIEENKKLLFLSILFFISIIAGIPYILNSFIINNEWYSKAGNDGWVSFWGSYLGGMFGGIGTLIAVMITTKQAKQHQIENLTITRNIQEENLKQIKIRNLNEKINDLRDKLNILNESKNIISQNNLFFKKSIDINSLDLTSMLEYSKNIAEFHGELLKQSGSVCIGDMWEEDATMMELSNQIAKRAHILIQYFIENYKVNNKDDGTYISTQITESIHFFQELNKKITDMSSLIKNEINSQIKEKYEFIE